MIKTIAVLLSAVMILGLAACGNSASQTEQPSTEENSVESRADMEETAENSRTTIEMNDPAARPAISGSMENME